MDESILLKRIADLEKQNKELRDQLEGRVRPAAPTMQEAVEHDYVWDVGIPGTFDPNW